MHRVVTRPVITSLGALAIALAALAPAVARATPSAGGERGPGLSAIVTSAENVSGTSPWDGLTCNATNIGTTDTLSVGEPDIAVNPRNPLNQVATWMDLYRDNIDTAYTTDGGRSWHRSIPMGLNDCSGGAYNPAIEGAYDTTVSFGPDGTAYLSSMEDQHYLLPPTSDYAEWTDVQRSTDGGATWSAPVQIPNSLNADDKDMVFADQKRPGNVYVAFRNTGFGLLGVSRGNGELLFSRSTDGGQSFTTTVLQSTGSAFAAPFDSQLSETADGTLVYTFDTASGAADAMSSVDGGLHWSAPVQVAPAITSPAPPALCGATIQTRSDGGHAAVIGGTTVALARVDDGPEGTGPGTVELSTSADGGKTWRTSVVLTTAQPILEAEIAADSQGRLALAYYQLDLPKDSCGASGAVVPARTLVTVSGDGGKKWSEPQTIGAPSWNEASAGAKNFTFGYWLGEYFGVAATRQGFAVVTIQGTSLNAGRLPVPIVGENSVIVAEVGMRI